MRAPTGVHFFNLAVNRLVNTKTMNPIGIDHQYVQSMKVAATVRAGCLARSLGLSQAEREDVQQEILLEMLERAPHFDPEKGSANTFTGMVSEHRAAEIAKEIIKNRVRVTTFSDFAGVDAANDDYIDGVPGEAAEGVVPLWGEDADLFANSMALRDLETSIAYMNKEQAALFGLLESHQDLASACRASGVSTATFYRRVSELQMHLRMFGFKSAA